MFIYKRYFIWLKVYTHAQCTYKLLYKMIKAIGFYELKLYFFWFVSDEFRAKMKLYCFRHVFNASSLLFYHYYFVVFIMTCKVYYMHHSYLLKVKNVCAHCWIYKFCTYYVTIYITTLLSNVYCFIWNLISTVWYKK